MTIHRPRYGRKLDDFIRGDVYDHPWELTVDGGSLALWQASFLDANPLYSSAPYGLSTMLGDLVEAPVFVEVVVGGERTELEDGLGRGDGPTGAGDLADKL